MQRYQSHKIVEAGRIISVTVNIVIAGGATLELEGDEMIEISGAVLNRISLAAVESGVRSRVGVSHGVIDGYFVRYPDGYESWSPAEAFEEGYDKVVG